MFRTMAIVIAILTVIVARSSGIIIVGVLLVCLAKNTKMTICMQKKVVTVEVKILMTIMGAVLFLTLVENIVNPSANLEASGTFVNVSNRTAKVLVTKGDAPFRLVYRDSPAVLLAGLCIRSMTVNVLTAAKLQISRQNTASESFEGPADNILTSTKLAPVTVEQVSTCPTLPRARVMTVLTSTAVTVMFYTSGC